MAKTGLKVPFAIAGVFAGLLVAVGVLNWGDTITGELDDGGTVEVGIDAPDGAVPYECVELPDDGGTTCYYCKYPMGMVDGRCVYLENSQ